MPILQIFYVCALSLIHDNQPHVAIERENNDMHGCTPEIGIRTPDLALCWCILQSTEYIYFLTFKYMLIFDLFF